MLLHVILETVERALMSPAIMLIHHVSAVHWMKHGRHRQQGHMGPSTPRAASAAQSSVYMILCCVVQNGSISLTQSIDAGSLNF